MEKSEPPAIESPADWAKRLVERVNVLDGDDQTEFQIAFEIESRDASIRAQARREAMRIVWTLKEALNESHLAALSYGACYQGRYEQRLCAACRIALVVDEKHPGWRREAFTAATDEGSDG